MWSLEQRLLNKLDVYIYYLSYCLSSFSFDNLDFTRYSGLPIMHASYANFAGNII